MKGWCTTVWAGAFGLVLTHRTEFGVDGCWTQTIIAFFPILPVFLFWFLEAILAGTARMHGAMGDELWCQLENLEKDNNLDLQAIDHEIRWASLFRKVSPCRKIKFIWEGGTLIPSVIAFYWFLLLLSVLATAVLYKLLWKWHIVIPLVILLLIWVPFVIENRIALRTFLESLRRKSLKTERRQTEA